LKAQTELPLWPSAVSRGRSSRRRSLSRARPISSGWHASSSRSRHSPQVSRGPDRRGWLSPRQQRLVRPSSRPAAAYPLRLESRGRPGALLRERTIGHARRLCRVVVIGRGPAGLQPPETAARRGHEVTLFERGAELGGRLRLAGRQPLHGEILEIVDTSRCHSSGSASNSDPMWRRIFRRSWTPRPMT